MLQDLDLERSQSRPRLEAELRSQPGPDALVHLQRAGLAPAAIQGDHQLTHQPLACRMLDHQCFKLAHHAAVLTQRQIGVDALLQRN